MSRGPYILKKQGRSRFVSLKNNQNLVKDNHYTKTEIYKRLIAVLKDTLFGQLPEKQDPALSWLTFGSDFTRAPFEAKEIEADGSTMKQGH
jgi:hypothetical protein